MSEAHKLRPIPSADDNGEETFPPTLAQQELLDFAKGANIDILAIEQLYVDLGAAASQIERQASTINALQRRLKMVLDALRVEQKHNHKEDV